MRIAADAPVTVRGAGVIVGLQGLVGIGFAVALLIRAMGGASTEGNNIYGQVGYFAVIGAAVVAVGVALVLGNHWARSPAMVIELLLLGVAWYAFGPSGRPEIGLPVGVLCVVVLYLLFSARSREWVMGVEEDDSSDGGSGTGKAR
ncbi:hypothetical protein [Actinophytocola sediminis]